MAGSVYAACWWHLQWFSGAVWPACMLTGRWSHFKAARLRQTHSSMTPFSAVAGILDVLMLAAGDKSERVQRKAVAAFGELLFFISHQGPAHEVFAPVRHPALKCCGSKQHAAKRRVPPVADACAWHQE